MSWLKMMLVLGVVVGTTLLITPYGWPAEVQLAWDPPAAVDGTPSQDVAGYKVYYGWTNQLYEFGIDVGNQTSVTIPGLEAGQQYYFSVVAYDHSLNESPFSEEVWTFVPVDPASAGRDSNGDGLLDTDELAIQGIGASLWEAEGDGPGNGTEEYQGPDPLNLTLTTQEVSHSWTNYSVWLTMRSNDDGAIGVIFRYQGPDDYYRFLWDSDTGQGQLTKRYNGAFTLLAESPIPYVPGQLYQVNIIADGGTLEVLIEGMSIFSVVDSDLPAGFVGLYTWYKAVGSFDDVLVQHLDTEEVLLWDDFTHDNLTNWTIVDEGTELAPSAWAVSDGVLVQSSKIHSELMDVPDIAYHGTYAVYTNYY